MTFKILDPNFVLWLWNRIKTMVKNYVTTYVSNNALASTTKYAASKDVGGAAELTVGIPFGKLDETSTSTVMTATVPGITELKSGVCMFLMNGRVTSASGYTININGLGAKPVYGTMAAATRSTTLFNVAYTGFFVFNEERVEGGCWDFYYGYDSNSDTIAYDVRQYNFGMLKPATACQRYQLLFTKMDGLLLPVYSGTYSTNTNKTLTTDSFNPFGQVYYYGYTTNIAKMGNFPAGHLYVQATSAAVYIDYSFNTKGSWTAGDLIYIVCVPQSDGSVKLHSNPIAKELPTTEDGLLYIRIGKMIDTTRCTLELHKPVYYFKDGAIRLWTNQPAIEKSITDTLGAGTALDLQDNEGTETTFVKRLSGGSNNVPSGLATIRGMKGKTVKWNQLFDNSIAKSGKVAVETNNEIITATVESNAVNPTYIGMSISSNTNIDKSHKFVASVYARVSAGSGTAYSFCACYGSNASKYSSQRKTNTTFERLSLYLPDITDVSYIAFVRFSDYTAGNAVQIKYPQLFDLTLIFGEGNEPETVEEFEAWLAENVGLQDYYEYSEPTLLGANIDSIKTEGFNLWDEEWEAGTIDSADGTTLDTGTYATGKIRSKNFIEVIPNTTYFTTDETFMYWEYDEHHNYIQYSNSVGKTAENGLFTTSSNCRYIKFRVQATSYHGGICINLSLDGSRNGEYEEYRAKTFPINITKLVSDGEPIFPYGLNRVGNVYDEIVCKNGVYKAIKRIGCVDLGTLTWTYFEQSTNTSRPYFALNISSFIHNIRKVYPVGQLENLISPLYSAVPYYAFSQRKFQDGEMLIYQDDFLYIKDLSYTTAAAFKTAMSGVLLFYELATPQEFTLNNFPCNYKVDKWGTEEMVCEGTALRPYITLSYGLNAVEKLKNFPLPPISCRVVNGALVVDNAEPYLAMGYKPMVFRWMRRRGRVTVNRNAESKSEKYRETSKRGWITYIPKIYAKNYNMSETPLVRIVPAHMEYDGEDYKWVDGKSTDSIDNTHSVLEVFDFDFQNDGIYYKNPMYLVTITVKNLGVTIGWGKDSKRLAKRDSTNESWYGFHNAYCRFGIGFVKRYPDKIEDVARSGLLVSNIAKFGVYHLGGSYSDIFDENNWRFAR